MVRPGSRRSRVPAHDRRRVGAAVAGLGAGLLLIGLLLLLVHDVPWVLSLCLVGWGVASVSRGIIQILDSRHAAR
jgi:hypothetical protein